MGVFRRLRHMRAQKAKWELSAEGVSEGVRNLTEAEIAEAKS